MLAFSANTSPSANVSRGLMLACVWLKMHLLFFFFLLFFYNDRQSGRLRSWGYSAVVLTWTPLPCDRTGNVASKRNPSSPWSLFGRGHRILGVLDANIQSVSVLSKFLHMNRSNSLSSKSVSSTDCKHQTSKSSTLAFLKTLCKTWGAPTS